MSESQDLHLQELNKRLLDLYMRLGQMAPDTEAYRDIQNQIRQIEAEKETIPQPILQAEKLQQYITILRSSAMTLQLLRQDLQHLSQDVVEDRTPDAIRQKNKWQVKLTATQKKVESYRAKLRELGMTPIQLDQIVLEGYREQNQRYLHSLVERLKVAVKAYVDEYYSQFFTLPENLAESVKSWELRENQKSLSEVQVRILDSKMNCMSKGIQYREIVEAIQSVCELRDSDRLQQLDSLSAFIRQSKKSGNRQSDMQAEVRNWMKLSQSGGKLDPTQVAVLQIMKDLRMYGVPEHVIHGAIKRGAGQSDGVMTSLKNRFRRDS